MNSFNKNFYRLGVGAVMYDPQGCIFAGERIDTPGAWQMPQGGIKLEEDPEKALLRELQEEIGAKNLRIQATYPGWLSYKIPSEILKKNQKSSWKGVIGQKQKWYLLPLPHLSEINIHGAHPEFSSWKLMTSEELIYLAPSFKKKLYHDIFSCFNPLIQACLT